MPPRPLSKSPPLKSTESSIRSRWPPHPTAPQIPDFILPNLYLSDLFTARSVLLPTYFGPGRPSIKYVLSLLDYGVSQPKGRSGDCVQKLIILDDYLDADLLGVVGEACDWIEACIQKVDGGVLVHCQLGQSRSGAIIVAYVMRKESLSYDEALAKVKKGRSVVKPNPGFMRQLKLWAEMEYNAFEGVPVEESAIDESVETSLRRKELYEKWKQEQRDHMMKALN